MEIERKFLVKHLPTEMNNEKIKKVEITQAYIQIGKENELRIRKWGNEYSYNFKKGSGLSRIETPAQKIDETLFNNMMLTKIGNIINKTRFFINLYDGLVAELDIYKDNLETLRTVEVEFKSEEQAKNFIPPKWFGEDVTLDKRFKNQSLALNGNPLTPVKEQTDDSGLIY